MKMFQRIIFVTVGAGLLTLLALPVALAKEPAKPPTFAGIPDRPEKLSFPPLNYEPPVPDEYRVELKSGPVAYVASDRELPLVNNPPSSRHF